MTGLRWDLSLENMVNNFFAFFPAAPYNNLLSGAFDVIQIFKCALPKYFHTLRLNIVKGLTVSPQPYGSTNSWCDGESFKRVELIRNSPDVRTEKMVSYRCKGRNKMLNVPAPTQLMGVRQSHYLLLVFTMHLHSLKPSILRLWLHIFQRA